jgi:hypothetical protein
MRHLALFALLLLAVTGCYRPTDPPQLGEGIALTIQANQGRLARSQAYVQAEVPKALQRQLGWRINPAGATARLELALEEEIIDVTANDSRTVPVQWMVRLRGTALLVSKRATLVGRFTGAGYYTSDLDEPEALRTAAQEAGKDLVAWIESHETRFAPDGTKSP